MGQGSIPPTFCEHCLDISQRLVPIWINWSDPFTHIDEAIISYLLFDY